MQNGRKDSSSHKKISEFEQVFRSHHAVVFRFLHRFFTSKEDIEDCLQETFLRFWRSRSHYEDQGHLRAYILTIARHLAIDHLRHHRPVRERTRYLQEMEPLEYRSMDSNRGEKKELADKVRKKVAQLPLAQRETFILFRYQGMSYEEIAELQGVSVKTVDSRLYRAMKRLAQHFIGFPMRNLEDGS